VGADEVNAGTFGLLAGAGSVVHAGRTTVAATIAAATRPMRTGPR
jgi:hypothetical protein